MDVINLYDLGNAQEVDKDFILKEFNKGSLLLINLKEQEYPYEEHFDVEEMIIAFQGEFELETETTKITVPQGSMIKVPKGIRHRFGSGSNGLILVAFGE